MPKKATPAGKRHKVSIHDVAREAGVALSTVSNALAGKDYVREATRAKVQEAADRLGYRASGVARALRMQRTFTIGVLLADVSNPSSPDFLRGIEDVADREASSLLVCNTDGLLEKQIAHMRVLLDRQVDGLVLISQYCDPPEVRQILESGTPFVLLQRRSRIHKDDYVGADNVEGITAALNHLAGFGHKRIGFMRGPIESSTVDERLDAFRQGVARMGLDTDPSLVVQGSYQVDGGYQAAQAFFAMKRPPSAILAANDMSAMGVLNAAHERGIRIPHDLSLIGLDDIQMASFAAIDLTTINLPKRDMGAAAATLLMQRIRRKRTVTSKQVSFPMKLIVRGSTGPA
jgi:LacI family transcriptional regulator